METTQPKSLKLKLNLDRCQAVQKAFEEFPGVHYVETLVRREACTRPRMLLEWLVIYILCRDRSESESGARE